MKTQARTLLTDKDRRRLISRRKYCRCSQRQLADVLGISQVHVSAVEIGKSQPGFRLLDKWCRSLGLKLKVEIE